MQRCNAAIPRRRIVLAAVCIILASASSANHDDPAAVDFKDPPEDLTDPSSLLRACQQRHAKLREQLRDCNNTLIKKRNLHAQDTANSASERNVVEANVSQLQDEIEKTESQIRHVEKENAILRKGLMDQLRNISEQVSALSLFNRGIGPEPYSHKSWKQIEDAIETLQKCDEEAARLQLDVDECDAQINADKNNHYVDEKESAQLEDSAESRAEMLRQKLELLKEQYGLCKARRQRLQKQLSQVSQVGEVPEPFGFKEMPEIPSSFLHKTHSLAVSGGPAEEAVQQATDARDAAAAEYQKLASAHREAVKAAEKSRKVVVAVSQKSQEVRGDMSRQHETLDRSSRKVEQLKSAVADKEAIVAGKRHEVEILDNKSHKAFLKAFVLEHEHSESKKIFEDAVVDARIATSRLERKMQDANEAKFNVSRLKAQSVTLDFKLANAREVDEAAQAKAIALKERLAESAKTLAEKERDLKIASEAARVPSSPKPSGGDAVRAAAQWIAPVTIVLTFTSSM